MRHGDSIWPAVRVAWVAAVCLGAMPALAASKAEKLQALSDDLFTNPVVRNIRIDIPGRDLNQLRGYTWRKGESPEDRPEVQCTVWEATTRYTNVALHLKGAAGSFRPVDSKPGLTLKFDQFADGQSFHGLEKISLNNSVQDPTYLSDKLCRELYERAGVPVPRADFATVELNGRQLGLYVLTEGWNRQFLKRYFKRVKGNLYDPAQGADLNRRLQVSSGDRPDDQSELAAVVAAAEDPDPAQRLPRLDKVVDMERFVALVALDNLTWNWDGYAMNKNNYRVFHDEARERVVIMPHGLDQMFWKPKGPVITGRNGLVARALVGSAEGRQQLLARTIALRQTFVTPEALTNRLNEIHRRIRPVVAREGLSAALRHERAVAVLLDRITQRMRSVDEQLEGIKNLFPLRVNQTVALTNWLPRLVSPTPAFEKSEDADLLHARLTRAGGVAWFSRIWIEEGTYTISGRIKTRALQVQRGLPFGGAGIRVWSSRKQTDGRHWGWFPYHESNDYLRRGEVAATNCPNTRLVGDTDWTEVTYEAELRHPIADLDVLCEVYGTAGEAWFDPKSFRITRRTDSCP